MWRGKRLHGITCDPRDRRDRGKNAKKGHVGSGTYQFWHDAMGVPSTWWLLGTPNYHWCIPHGSALQEVGLNLSAGIVSFTSLTTFVASPGGKRVRGPCNYMTCIHRLLLFFDSLLFLKVPRDRSAACKIMCLFVWVSGKLDGFIGIFFFKGLSHPHLVNISMFRVFEVLSVNW